MGIVPTKHMTMRKNKISNSKNTRGIEKALRNFPLKMASVYLAVDHNITTNDAGSFGVLSILLSKATDSIGIC